MTVKLTDSADLAFLINQAAAQMPLPDITQPQNELRPDPARLAFELKMLRDRVDMLEDRVSRVLNWKKHDGRL